MKKIFLTIVLLFSLSSVYSQWSYQLVKNDFDDPYRIAYTSENNNAILKLENVGGSIFFYVQGGYYCDENPSVDLVFVVNGQNIKFNVEGFVNSSKDALFFTTDLINSEMLESFKKCSLVKIRVNESTCTNEIYSFNMGRSTSALNYILGK
jgi:hypothetical protein